MSKSTKRCLGILAGFVTAGVIVAAITLVVRRERAAQRYAAAVARLNVDDPYWRLDDLVASLAPTPLPDDENLARPLAELHAARGRPDADIVARRWELVVDLVPNVRLTRDQWRAVIDSVEDAEAGIEPALGLDRYPRGRHPVTYTRDGLSTLLPHVDRISSAQYLLDDLHLAAVQRGDAATALRAFRATLHLGRSVREEPAAVCQLVRIRMRRAAVRGLERLLGHVELTDAQLAGVERELRTELADDPGLLAARGELALMSRVMEAIRGGVIKPSMIRRFAPILPGPATPADRAADWVRDRVGMDVVGDQAELLEIGVRTTAAARLPWPDRWTATRALPGEVRSELVSLLVPNLPGLFANFVLDEARVRCALAAVAVERRRLTRGDWPASLDVLGPLPGDPFTGQPLVLKRLADGVTVYSVGPDGSDDGGALAESSGSHMKPNADLGFRLWDVPRRNRPASAGGP